MALLVARHTHGHRREYAEVLSRVLSSEGEAVSMVVRSWLHLLSRQPILFLMIEDAPAEFFFAAFLRALFGCRTAGLLFRAGECIAPSSPRLKLKRLLLRVLKLLPRTAAITLFPHSIEPRFSQIARFGINDPQFWDLPLLAEPEHDTGHAVSEICDKAVGRRLLVALGRQDRQKGFEYFCKTWLSNAKLQKKWLFISVGKIDPDLRLAADEFEAGGGLVIDRFVEDAELRALYGRADMVWGCYAPDYDQSSGIFGRAIQFGVPTTVREGAYIARIADQLSHRCVTIPWNSPYRAASAISSAERLTHTPSNAIEGMRRTSIATLLLAMGLARQRHRLTNRAAWNIAEVAVTALSMFAIYKLVVEQLGIASLGVYSLVLATTVFARVGDLGLAAGLARFVARSTSRSVSSSIRSMQYVETAFVSNFLLYATLGAVLFLPLRHALQYALQGNSLELARQLVPYAVFNFLLFNLSNVSSSALVGFHRSDLKSVINIAATLILVSVTWLAIPSAGLVGIALGQIVQNCFTASTGWLFVLRLSGERRLRVPSRIHLSALREMASFGLRLQVTNIVSLAYEPATKFVLAALAGPAALGLFELAYRVVVQARALVLAPSQNLTPMFAAMSTSNVSSRQKLYDNGVVLFVVAGGLGLSAVVAASPLISLFLVHHGSMLFTESVVLLALGWFVNVVSEPAYLLAIADGRTTWNTLGTAIASLGSPVLGYILWHVAGLLGIVAGFAIATAAGATAIMLMNAREAGLDHSLPSFQSWREWYTRSGIRFGSLVTFGANEAESNSEMMPILSE